MDINLEEYSEKYGIEFESVKELVNYFEDKYISARNALDGCNSKNALTDDELEFMWNKYKVDGLSKSTDWSQNYCAYLHMFYKKNSKDGDYFAFHTAYELSKEHLIYGIEHSKNL